MRVGFRGPGGRGVRRFRPAAEELLVEVWGGLGESTNGLIRKAAEQRANRLTHAEFEREATWATRKFVPSVMQRISVAAVVGGDAKAIRT